MRESDLIRCVFTGTALEPDGNFAMSQLHDRLGAGQVVLVDLDPERSRKSHNHQFGFVAEAWKNLPEELQGMPYAASADHLRRHALIMTGFRHVDMIALGDDTRAARVAERMRHMDAREDRYSITEAKGPVIYRMTAESQRMKAMGGKRFKKSKQAILEWLADLIGVSPEDLAKAGKEKAA